MKHLIIIPLLIMSLISSPSWGETLRDLVKREGVFYKRFTDVPFTGKVEGKQRGSIKNGWREGSWEYYYE